MEGKEEDVKLGANKFSERQPLGTSAQTKDYKEPPPAPLFEPGELSSWSFWRAGIAEFVATFLFLYITVLTVMGVSKSGSKCSTVGIQGIAWAFGGMIFALVYCTAGISGTASLCSVFITHCVCLCLILWMWGNYYGNSRVFVGYLSLNLLLVLWFFFLFFNHSRSFCVRFSWTDLLMWWVLFQVGT